MSGCQGTFSVRSRRELDGKVLKDLWPTCSYCGSVTPMDFLTFLQTSGTHYSGSDWKYGWPHKFYVEPPCEPFTRCYSATSTGKGDFATGEGQFKDFKYEQATKRYHKFYAIHLEGEPADVFDLWHTVAKPILGVDFFMSDNMPVDAEKDKAVWYTPDPSKPPHLVWRAPPGIQRWGVIP